MRRAEICKFQEDGSYVRTRNNEIINKNSFLVAACNNNWDLIKLFTDNRYDMNYAKEAGTTAILWAAETGKWDIVHKILEGTAYINLQDNFKRSILHVASANNQWELVKILVNNGSNINAIDNFGRTSVIIAASMRKWDVVQWLILRGANIDSRDGFGRSILLLAASSKNWELVKWLLIKGADPSVTDRQGRTVLHLAASVSNMEMVQLLVEDFGMNYEQQDKTGSTPVNLAATHNDPTGLVYKYLVSMREKKSSNTNGSFRGIGMNLSNYENLVIQFKDIEDEIRIKPDPVHEVTIFEGGRISEAVEEVDEKLQLLTSFRDKVDREMHGIIKQMQDDVNSINEQFQNLTAPELAFVHYQIDSRLEDVKVQISMSLEEWCTVRLNIEGQIESLQSAMDLEVKLFKQLSEYKDHVNLAISMNDMANPNFLESNYPEELKGDIEKASSAEMQQSLDEILKYFEVKLTHMGNSHFHCDGKIYLMKTQSIEIQYSIFEEPEGKPITANNIFNKLRRGEMMLSPYALWKFALLDTSGRGNYDKLMGFVQNVDLILEGEGQYLNEDCVTACNQNVEMYYKVDKVA
ncbi:hypothetical protein C0J52_14952 [Blattella germanica]|nr:hypothetical protein C0J52_14952 [Blattella germanica]